MVVKVYCKTSLSSTNYKELCCPVWQPLDTCGYGPLNYTLGVNYTPDFKDLVYKNKNIKYLIDHFYIGYTLKC